MRKILTVFSDRSVKKGRSNPPVFFERFETHTDLFSNADIDYTLFEDLELKLDGGNTQITNIKNDMDIQDYDLVHFRSWSSSNSMPAICAIYLDHHSVPYIDSEARSSRLISKIHQGFCFWDNNIPTPRMVAGTPQMLRKRISTIENMFEFPVILKAANSKKGQNNYLVKDRDKMLRLLEEKSKYYIIQEYIENEGDLRILVFGGEPVFAMSRIGDKTKTHLNNTSIGGEAEILEIEGLDEEVRRYAIKAARVTNREISGVDIITDKNSGSHYVLEVNRSPQISSGSFVPEKMTALANYYLRLMEGK